MNNYRPNLGDILLDFDGEQTEAIALEQYHIDQAVELSSQMRHEAIQWQAYLNVLALLAFEEWLSQRAPDLLINHNHCSVLHPQYAHVIEAVCNLRVGDFKVCLIATGSLTDELISIPRAAIELPEFTPHFYVVVEVQEEIEQATVQGFLRYDDLQTIFAGAELPGSGAEFDWNYQLNVDCLNTNTDELLLNLRCLELSAILLPEIPKNRLATLSQMQTELTTLLTQVHDRPLWQVLTWEQGSVVLTSSDLLHWLYQTGDTMITDQRQETCRLIEVMQWVTQPVMNVAMWLKDELDQVAQELSWVLLPTFSGTGYGMRSHKLYTFVDDSQELGDSPTQELEVIIAELQRTGIEISPHACGAYQNLKLAATSLRLYAITWPILSPDSIPEWTLLLVLGGQFLPGLPPGITLRVSDETGVLIERLLEDNTQDTYLYTQIVGNWNEQFLVTITLKTGETLTLPPFAFRMT